MCTRPGSEPYPAAKDSIYGLLGGSFHTGRTGCVSESRLDACMPPGKNIVYGAHIKPRHVLAAAANDNGGAQGFISSAEELIDVMVGRFGTGVVMTVHRRNALARRLSAFEWTYREDGYFPLKRGSPAWEAKAWQAFGDAHLPLIFQAEELFLQAGLDAARAAGATVLEFEMHDATIGLCETLTVVRDAMADRGPAWSKHAWSQHVAGTPGACKLGKPSHTGASRVESGLRGRIGGRAAKAVEKQLKGTPYEWMLVTSQELPPKGWAPPNVTHVNAKIYTKIYTKFFTKFYTKSSVELELA